ncbi:MAG: sporulation protein YqfD, partial [Clostridia bacterium]|nr:sporulation protein YqfD [Clostridia bacterium]
IGKKSEFETDPHSYSNVVATRDGIIDRVEVLRGKSEVIEGQSVREGELLISGVIESTHGESRLENAIGKVYATTSRHFSVNIPLAYEEKILSDAVCTEKNIKFFSDRINIFKKDGKTDENCVKIEEEASLSFASLPSLPIGIISESIREYKTVKKSRSYEEASSLAFFELQAIIEAELSEAELLQKTVKTEITDNEFIILCDIICLENIAKDQPIKTE